MTDEFRELQKRDLKNKSSDRVTRLREARSKSEEKIKEHYRTQRKERADKYYADRDRRISKAREEVHAQRDAREQRRDQRAEAKKTQQLQSIAESRAKRDYTNPETLKKGNRMNRTDCVKRIVASAASKITASEARDILNDYEKTARTIARQKKIDLDTAMRELMKPYTDRLKAREALNARRRIIKNRIYTDLTNRVDAFERGGLDTYNALQAVLVGTQKNIKGGRLSISAQRIALEESYLNQFSKQLRTQNLDPFIRTRTYEPEVAKALWDLSLPEEQRINSPDIPKEAKAIAGIIRDRFEDIRLRMNRSGADIAPLQGYIGHQSHDVRKMLKSGYNAWAAYVGPRVDTEKSFGSSDPKELDKFLKSFYEATTSDLRKEAPPEIRPDGKRVPKAASEGYNPTQILADKVSASRVLYFKDADSAYNYNNQYGTGSLYETVIEQFRGASRDIALLENLGPDPDTTWSELTESYYMKNREKLRTGDEKTRAKVKAMFDKKYRLDSLYNYVNGSLTAERHPTLGAVGQMVRMYQSFIKLGGAAISSLSDISNKALVLQSHGLGVFESYSRSLSHLGTYLTTPERKELAYSLSRMGGSPIADMVGRYNTDDSRVGRMGRIMRMYFKLNLMDWWQNSQHGGYMLDLSRIMGSYSKDDFDVLPINIRTDLQNVGIDSGDWEHIRKSVVQLSDGAHYLTTDGVRGIAESAELDPVDIDRLETKLKTFFSDRAGHAIIEPGDYERWLLSMGTQRGTVSGELMRIVTQFKAYPLTFYTRAWGRILNNNSAMTNLVQLAVMSTMFGYVSNLILDLSKGIKPKPLTDPKALLAAYNRGGGLGILAEALFSNYSFGKSLALTAAGPSARTIDDVAGLWNTYREVLSDPLAAQVLGEDIRPKTGKDAASDTVRFARRNLVPNLFYTRAAVDYLFYYNLLELTNPGSLRRMERRQNREYGTEYFVKPSDVVGR